MRFIDPLLTPLSTPFFGNPLWLWLTGLGIALLVWLALWCARRAECSKLRGHEGKPDSWRNVLAAIIERTHPITVAAVAILAGSSVLHFDARMDTLRRVLVVVALIQVGRWAGALLGALVARMGHRSGSETLSVVADSFGRVILWSLVVLLALDNLGFKVTTLLAGLGIGGVAVALASQKILGDLFASVSIVLDRPFEVGDFIVVGEHMGSVERIGLRTTQLKSITGEQLLISNGDLLNSRIRNYKRMRERRAQFTFGVVYETPAAKLAHIAGWVKEIIGAQSEVRFERAHLAELGDKSVVFEAAYYVTNPDHNRFMDVQQSIHLAIHRRMESEGIEFAPSRKPWQERKEESREPQSKGVRILGAGADGER